MPASKLTAEAKNGVLTLWMYGPIGESMWGDAIDAPEVLDAIQQAGDVSEIVVRLNSYGGDVAEGVAIHNVLRSHGARITTIVDGVAVSIASLIAMAGDELRMHATSVLMIHAPWSGMMGNANDARRFADMLDTYAAAMSESYARKTGKPSEEMLDMLTDGEDHWFTAAEALDAGLIDGVIDGSVVEPVDVAALLAEFDPPQRIAAMLRDNGRAPASTITGGRPMPMDKAPASGENTENIVDIDSVRDEARRDALRNEQTRRAAIRAIVTPFASRSGVSALLDSMLDDTGCDENAARNRLLDHIGADAAPVNTASGAPAYPGLDEGDKRIEAATQSLLARMGREKADYSNPYRGMRLGELARDSLERAGVDTKGKMADEFARSALSLRPQGAQTTSDFPVILENTMHKLVLMGFQAQTSTHQAFVKYGDVSDFREWNRIVPGVMGNLGIVNEHGEYENKAIPDGVGNAVQAVRRGNILSVTPEVIVNDDTGYIVGLAEGAGRMGQRSIERAVYEYLETNPTLSDGVALFHASHGNLASSGAAPTVDLIDSAAVAMAQQTGPGDDAEYLDITPYAAVANVALRGNLVTIIGAEFDPDTANKLHKPNKVRGIVQEIATTPRLAAAPWYLFADPNVYPVIEVVFLNGQREPRLVTEENFRTGGMAWRVELPFGVGAVDYRGAYQNPGE